MLCKRNNVSEVNVIAAFQLNRNKKFKWIFNYYEYGCSLN